MNQSLCLDERNDVASPLISCGADRAVPWALSLP